MYDCARAHCVCRMRCVRMPTIAVFVKLFLSIAHHQAKWIIPYFFSRRNGKWSMGELRVVPKSAFLIKLCSLSCVLFELSLREENVCTMYFH